MSMINALMQPKVQEFIREHELDDERELMLRNKIILGVPAADIATQIAGRKKVKKKIPLYWETKGIIFPPNLHLEQSSSERTARFKAAIPSTINIPTERILDLTGGFGVDSFFFSRRFKEVVYVEPNLKLGEIARHNHRMLDAKNIHHWFLRSEDFLAKDGKRFDLVYVDPSRRDEFSRKVFKLGDCTPPITQLLDTIFSRTKFLMVKASPLMDISQGILDLKNVHSVFVIAVGNECRDVIFLCLKDHDQEPEIKAVSLEGDRKQIFSFRASEERDMSVGFSEPDRYVYEPNAAIMKSGAFKSIAHAYGVQKIHPHTHLYTSSMLRNDFPGRVLMIRGEVKGDRKSALAFFPEGKANVVVRNYPATASELKAKLRLHDGGDEFLLGLTTSKRRVLLAATRVITGS